MKHLFYNANIIDAVEEKNHWDALLIENLRRTGKTDRQRNQSP